MMENLTISEKQTLLLLAREALESAVRGSTLSAVDDGQLTPLLMANGASFVTLTIHDQLRGCIGSLQPYQPLYMDVREHAVAAALNDYRFAPVSTNELAHIRVEVSRLTMPETLVYLDANDLLNRLRPGIDGVILRDGPRRATFLPQVWEQIPDKEEFLRHLCVKMNAASNLWQKKHIDVQIYQVEDFHEQGKTSPAR